LYEMMKLIRRIPENPFFLGSLARVSGFFCAMLDGEKCIPPKEVVSHLKREQMDLLKNSFMGRSKEAF